MDLVERWLRAADGAYAPSAARLGRRQRVQTDWKSADGVEHLLGPPGSVWNEIKVLIRPELDDEPLRRTLPASLSETCDRDAA